MGQFRDHLRASTGLATFHAALSAWHDPVVRVCLEHDLDHEVRLSRGRFARFLDQLAAGVAAGNDVARAWSEASRDAQLGGPRGHSGTLVRVYRWDRLASLLETAGSYATGTGDTVLTSLLATQRPAALSGLKLGRAGDPVWACFDAERPDVHPARGRPRARLMDLLGLPHNPSNPAVGYPRSGRLVALRFQVPRTSVPTVADAGWDNPWWMPAPAKGPSGRARDVAGLVRADLATARRRRGLAEVVTVSVEAAGVVRPDPSGGRFAEEVA